MRADSPQSPAPSTFPRRRSDNPLLGQRALAIIALVALAIIWGSTFVATKALYGQVGPLTLAALRFILASFILVPITLPAFRAIDGPTPWGRLSLLGLFGVTLYYICQNLALVYTSATDASLILACIPVLVAIGAGVFLREKQSLLRVVCMLASVVGVVIIVLTGSPEPSAPNPLLGDLLIFGAAISWTAYTTLGKKLDRLAPMVITTGSVVFGGLMLIPFAIWEFSQKGLPILDLAGWAGVAYLGVGASALAYALWNYGLRRLDAGEAALFLNLIPIIGVALAALTLNEPLGLLKIVGTVLIVGGVTLASRVSAPRDSRPAVGSRVSSDEEPTLVVQGARE